MTTSPNDASKRHSSPESDVEESLMLEERLKKLLTNNTESRRPRNLFNNNREVPKLRRSVVGRAVQNVISSTPMPTKRKNFFFTENSLSISPVESVCEEVEANQEQNQVGNENNIEPKPVEAKVILTRAPLPATVIISDSETGEEENIVKVAECKKDGNEARTKDHSYNTRSSLKHIENSGNKVSLPQDENIEHNKPKAKLTKKYSLMKNSKNKGHSRVDLSNSKNKSKLSKSVNNNCSQKIVNKSVRSGLDNNSQEIPTKFKSKKKKSKTNTSNEESLAENHEQLERCPSLDIIPHNASNSRHEETKQNISGQIRRLANSNSSKRGHKGKSSLRQTDNLKMEQTPDALKVVCPQVPEECSIAKTCNNINQDATITCQKMNINSIDKKSPENVSLNISLIKTTSLTDISDVHYQKRISPRKLSFTLQKEDKINEKGVTSLQGNKSDVIQSSSKLSKIPYLRKRNKSREKKLTLDTNLPECGTYTIPPKRPPRTKKMLRNRIPMPLKQSKSSEAILVNQQGKVNEDKLAEINFEAVFPDNLEDKIDRFPNATALTQNECILTPQKDVPNQIGVGNETNMCKTVPVTQKTLVEMGTSPISFTPEANNINLTEGSKKMTEAGTSTCNLTKEKDIVADSEKAKSLNLVILKISQRIENARKDPQKSDKGIGKDNCDMLNKEVQTSLERGDSMKCKRVVKGNKPQIMVESDDLSNSSSASYDIIIKDFEREKTHGSFKMLDDSPENISFNSDKVLEEGTRNNEDNRPWRLIDSLEVPHKRFSYNLNFLRSAREIEMEKKSQHESGSELQIEKDVEAKIDFTLDTKFKEKKLHTYSRATYSNKKAEGILLQPSNSNSTDAFENAMSDLIITQSNSDNHNKEEIENIGLQSKQADKTSGNRTNRDNQSRASIQNNIEDLVHEDTHLDFTVFTEVTENQPKNELPLSVLQKNNDESIDRNINKEISKSKSCTKKSKTTKEDIQLNASVNVNNIIIPKASSLKTKTLRKENRTTAHRQKLDKSINEKVIRSRRNRRGDVTNSEINIQDDDNVILAVQLENSVFSQVEQPQVKKTNISSQIEKDIMASNERSEDLIISPPAAFSMTQNTTKATRTKRKNMIPENDDGVSTTTSEIPDTLGIRRSARERKPIHRQIVGAIATHSEKVLQYYNNILVAPNTVANSTRSKNKKKIINKNKDDEAAKKPVKRNGKIKEKKGLTNTNIKEQDAELAKNNAILDSHPLLNAIKEKEDFVNSCGDRNDIYIEGKITSTSTGDPCMESNVDHTSKDVIPKKKCKISEQTRIISDTTRKTRSCRSVHHSKVNDDVNDTVNKTGNNFHDFSYNAQNEERETFLTPGFLAPHHNLNNVESSNANRLADPDSGRSTMLRSTTFEETNGERNKPLTGRVSKNYKKKKNACTKISKVLSRSRNTSIEQEILNENQACSFDYSQAIDTTEDARLRRSSVIQSQLVDSEYITLLVQNSIISMRYVEQNPKFKLVNDLLVTDALQNIKDGGSMGYLKLLPNSQKSLHIARRFSLFYFVTEGEGLIQVHNKTSQIKRYATFIIPLGVEYTILNTSKETALVLAFVKVAPKDKI